MIKVLITTNLGNITAELNNEKSPLTVANFVRYVKEGHYTNTIFHRVIDGFMIQGGGFEVGMKQKQASETVQNEANNGLRNERYTLAMARTSDPQSATAQFFINVADNNFLNYPGQDGWGYAVFGKVIEGQDVIDTIRQVTTHRVGMFVDVPVDPVVIHSITVVNDEVQAELQEAYASTSHSSEESEQTGRKIPGHGISGAHVKQEAMENAIAETSLAPTITQLGTTGKATIEQSNELQEDVPEELGGLPAGGEASLTYPAVITKIADLHYMVTFRDIEGLSASGTDIEEAKADAIVQLNDTLAGYLSKNVPFKYPSEALPSEYPIPVSEANAAKMSLNNKQ